MKLKPKHLKPIWNQKNILFISLVLVFSITLGVAVAWLSGRAGDPAYLFEGAFVDCEVVETFDGTVKSNVQVKNTGNVDAYIRATYTVNWVKDGTQNATPLLYHEQPQVGTDYTISYGSGWTLSNDGYFYYNQVITPEALTGNFIANLTDNGTAPAGYHLQVTVLPEAVQAEGVNAYQAAWGITKNSPQVRPAANQANKTLDTMVLTMNIRIAGDQYADGTYAGDTGEGEWNRRRDDLAQYLRGSERDIICLQEVGQDQWHYLEDNVNNGNQALTYEFVYWSFDSSQLWYRGLMIMFDVDRYEYVGYELVYFTDDGGSGKFTYDDGTTNENGEKPYHYRGALIVRLKEKSTGIVVAVCNVHTDYPADGMVGKYDCTQLSKIDELRERDVSRALTRLYAQDADFHIMAGDFNADAYRNPNWYNTITAKMQDVLPGETKKTINDWDDRGYPVYQVESPLATDVNGPVDFIFVDKEAEVFGEYTDDSGNVKNHTRVHDVGYNYGADWYSRHFAVFAKVKCKNH